MGAGYVGAGYVGAGYVGAGYVGAGYVGAGYVGAGYVGVEGVGEGWDGPVDVGVGVAVVGDAVGNGGGVEGSVSDMSLHYLQG
ncbi:hypothetical protein GCM10020216_016800 [Nonomuraea helvata]